jgi:hypothetical protein
MYQPFKQPFAKSSFAAVKQSMNLNHLLVGSKTLRLLVLVPKGSEL